MKQLLLLAAALLLTIPVATQAQDDYDYELGLETYDTVPEQMGRKWARGSSNLLTGLWEIPMQTRKGYQEGVGEDEDGAVGRAGGATLGLFKGLYYSVGRLEYGVWEMLTFWSANPPHNSDIGPNFTSRYPWGGDPANDGDVRSYDENRKSDDALDIFESKFRRGASNLIFGGSELVYQVRAEELKGEEGSLAAGVGRGLYYTVGRELNGAHDLVFIMLPQPIENVGVPWHLRNPWSYLYGPMPEEKVEAIND